MADIENRVALSAESLLLITKKEREQSFCHTSWGDEDLEPVRKEIRDHYREEQTGTCSFCRQNISLVSALNCHVEHIVPKKLHIDFMFVPTNLCVICADCNQIKRDQETLNEIPETMTRACKRKQYPRSSGAFKIVHPHYDNWDDHILIFEELYVDKSMKGHFTIGACKLNRKLHEFGWEEKTTTDEELNQLMNDFLDESDSVKRMRILNKIKRIS